MSVFPADFDRLSAQGIEGARILAAEERRRQAAIDGLYELLDDEHLGAAARTALDCVQRGADPVMLLLLIEAAQEPRSLDARGRFGRESDA